MGEYEYYRGLLWTAPELLRAAERPRNGTRKGDVYSFGVVLQELVYRTMPYFMDDKTPKGRPLVMGPSVPFQFA